MMLLTAMFHLSKWYLDCVTEDGRVFVAYSARLRWHALSLDYTTVLGGASSLKPCPAPECSGDRIEWRAPKVGVEGSWLALEAPVCETLYDADGTVEWSCLLPRGSAQVRVGSERLRGLGYVERLDMTVPPWRLPIDELHWGRLLTAAGSVVWIDWRGAHSKRLVLRNGAAAEPELLTRLELGRGLVLRDGALGRTALSIIPKVERLFPWRILHVRETKWRSRGLLDGVSGWAIHEEVRWP
jgi:hypothetical protein